MGVSPPGRAAQGRNWRTGGKRLLDTIQTARSRFHFTHSRPLCLTGPWNARSQLGAGTVRHPLGSFCCWKAVTSGEAGDCKAALSYSNQRDARLTAHLSAAPPLRPKLQRACSRATPSPPPSCRSTLGESGCRRCSRLLSSSCSTPVRRGGFLTRSVNPPPLTSISSKYIAAPLAGCAERAASSAFTHTAMHRTKC